MEHLLNKQLTVIEEFHSHLEPMKFLKQSQLADQVSHTFNPLADPSSNFNVVVPQISFSYSQYGPEKNILDLEDGFDHQIDPYRFLSLHCLLFQNFSFCPKENSVARNGNR